MLSRIRSSAVVFALALALAPCTLLAQTGSAHTDVIAGWVRGLDNKPLAGVRVEARSIDLLTSCSKTTAPDGRYAITFLDGGGQYQITVRAPGMQPLSQNIARLQDEDRLEADFAMAPAQTAQDTASVRTERVSGTGATASPHCG